MENNLSVLDVCEKEKEIILGEKTGIVFGEILVRQKKNNRETRYSGVVWRYDPDQSV